jgi:uncharacterized membrane protein YjjB (DUF3815 family)
MFLRFGQYSAVAILGDQETTEFKSCTHGIDEYWYFLFVPLASFSWSGLFVPNYVDLPLMGMHGVLAFTVAWACSQAKWNANLNNFLAAMAVTLSAGIISRFTGRQALGNVYAGLYVLLPGGE